MSYEFYIYRDEDMFEKSYISIKNNLIEYVSKPEDACLFRFGVLDKKNEPIDTVSVVDVLTKNNDLETVGGAFYISGLVDLVPTTAHVARYIKIVMEKAILRNLIYLTFTITAKSVCTVILAIKMFRGRNIN